MLRKLTRMIRKGEAGFTLIELMIVILIILILASILVPQFGLAQERARKAKCVSNQRNLETSVAMWTTDNTNAIYTGNLMNASTPSFTALTSSPQYALAGAFAEPDDPAQSTTPNGVDYYLSQGSPTAGTPSAAAPSYGHVACAADKVADTWVASYDGTAGTINNINHGRGASASP